MLIIRQDPFTGEINTRNIDVSQDQLDAWMAGLYIQDAMPHLTSSEREFIKTGIVDEVWDAITKFEED